MKESVKFWIQGVGGYLLLVAGIYLVGWAINSMLGLV